MTLFGDLDVSTLRDAPPGRQPVHTYLPPAEDRAEVVGVLPQEAPRRPAGLRDRAAGRGVGGRAGRQPRRGLRGPGQRRAGGVSPGTDPRPHDAGARRTPAMDDFRRGETQVLVSTVGGRGGRRRAQRHADDDRGGRAVRPGPIAPAARPHQPRRAPGLLLRVCRPADRRSATSGWRRSSSRPTASSWPRSISSCAAPATCSAPGSTACRRCGSPTCCATRPCSKKPAATPESLVAADPGLARPEHALLAPDGAGALRQVARPGRRGLVAGRLTRKFGLASPASAGADRLKT